MFSSLLKSSSAKDNERNARYVEQLKQLVGHYPIGEKINYYPEYLEDINLETIILGYEINEKPLYARDHVRVLEDTVEFYLEDTDETLAAIDIASLALIVPDTSELEKTLDYNSKAVVGRSGQFVRGNSITLVATGTGQGTPIMDTAVLKRTQVKQGYYQNYKVVTLDPKLDSLTTKENRQQKRMELSLACTLFNPEDDQSGQQGKLIDCSELCVGIDLPQAQSDNGSFTEGMPTRLNIPMPVLDRTFELSGEVIATRDTGTVVVKLMSVKKADKFEELQLVDRLDLRAAFVQCSHEKRAPDSDDDPASKLVC